MTNPNPIDAAIVDNTQVAKASVRGYEKARVRMRVADANEVRNTDFSGQFGGVYVAALDAMFDLNASDATSADDGVNVLVDAAGNRFIRVGQLGTLQKVTKKINTAGVDVTLADTETADIIAINNTGTAAINVFLPDSTVRKTTVKVVDSGGNAATYNITVKPKSGSGQTVLGGSAGYVIDGNYASITLDLLDDASGYI